MDQSVRLLLNAFPGSRIIMDIEDIKLGYLSNVDYARHRALVRRSITLCTACELRCGMDEGGWSPVPYAAPPISARSAVGTYAVLGEAPGPHEAKQGQPFVGKSGKLLRSMLQHVGLEWDMGTRFNTVSCFPHSGSGKGLTIRSPAEAEMRSCRGNLISQLSTLSTPYIILAGSHAVKAWRNDLRVGEVKGRVFTWHVENVGGFYVFPITHPAAVLRQHALKDSVVANLRWIADIIKGVADVSDFIDYTCIVCGSRAEQLDPDSVPYCERHWGRYGGAWQFSRKYWETDTRQWVKGRGRKKKLLTEGQQNLLDG